MGVQVVISRFNPLKIGARSKSIQLTAILLFLVSTAMGAPRKNVLILHEGSRLLPYQVLMAHEMQKDLTSGMSLDVEIFEEYLDNWRLTQDMSRAAHALDAKYSGKNFSLVIADGNHALRLLIDHPPNILRGIPVVFVSENDFNLLPDFPRHITGVATHVDYAATVRLAQALQPGLQHLYYIDSEPLAATAKGQILQSEFQAFRGQLEIVFWEQDDLATLLNKVNKLPPNSAVLFDTYFQDPSGKPYIPAQVCALVARSANAPVYTVYQTMIGTGALGGVVVNFEAIGSQAARIALALLRGAKISDFPIERSQNEVMIDWRVFEKLQLKEKQLPSAATVLYREPTMWARYRWYIAIGVIVILFELFLILKLAIEGKKRKESEKSARELAGRLIHAQEQERRRIAGELHDDVSQRLALVCLQIDTMRVSPPDSQEGLVRELSVLYDETDLISSDLHQFSRELHPNILEKLGLTSALRRYCSEFSAHRKIDINIDVAGEEPSISLQTALALFRVGQECLMNAAKHSQSPICNVWLSYKNDRIILDIKDQGIGFDTKKLREESGLGIESMRERLRSVGGTLRIESNPHCGTRIYAEAPIRRGVDVQSNYIAEQSPDISVA